MDEKSVRAVYKDGHFIPLEKLKLEENSRVILNIVEILEKPQSQVTQPLESKGKEDLIRKIMLNSGCSRTDAERLFETQGLWLDIPKSKELIEEIQKGFKKWHIEEW